MSHSPKHATHTEQVPQSSGLALFVCDATGRLLLSNTATDSRMSHDPKQETAEGKGDDLTAFLQRVLDGEESTRRRWLRLRNPATGRGVRTAVLGLRIPDAEGGLLGAVAVVGPWDGPAALSPGEPEGYLGHSELEVVSHELRTPINAVVGYATLLHERVLGDLSADQDHAVRRIEAAAQQLLAAVNHALLLAHIDVGDFDAGDFASRRGSIDASVPDRRTDP